MTTTTKVTMVRVNGRNFELGAVASFAMHGTETWLYGKRGGIYMHRRMADGRWMVYGISCDGVIGHGTAETDPLVAAAEDAQDALCDEANAFRAPTEAS